MASADWTVQLYQNNRYT